MTEPSNSDAMGLETAKILLDIKAVNFRPEEPYILTAGWASPVYIDCRRVISFNAERRRIIEMGAERLRDNLDVDAIDAVAGGETAGIPYAAWFSDALDKPMLYVRKKPKGFGRDAQIEGYIEEGKHVLLVEDLTTDGGSKLAFVEALREAGVTCSDTFVVFYYGVFANALADMAEVGIGLHYLADWHHVLKVAEEGGYFDGDTIAGVREFLADPVAWSKANGGRGADG